MLEFFEKRDNTLWNNLKVFLLISIVLTSFIDQVSSDTYKSIFLFFISFQYPLYIFIAGLTHKDDHIVEKASIYFMLYVFAKTAIFAVQTFFGKEYNFALFKEGGTPWLFFALGAFTVMSYVFRNTNKRVIFGVWLFIGCCVGYDTGIGDSFVLSRILVFFPFYLAGTMVSKDLLEKATENKIVKLISLAILVIWAILCVFALKRFYILRHLFMGRNPFNDQARKMGFFYRLVCYILSAVFGFSLIAITPRKPIKYLTEMGTRTAQSYFWHRIVLYALTNMGLHKKIAGGGIGKLIWMAIAVITALILSTNLFVFPINNIVTILETQNKK